VLLDTYGRVATDLRVSLTDRCNLRCTYCMPEEGLQWLAKPELLTDDEIVRMVRIAVTLLGVTEVRFTGGEPLLRPGLTGIIARCAALEPRPRLSLTTNGIGLARTAEALREAGLDRVNVSLDTLRPEVFKALTRRDRHHDVLAGLAAARATGLAPVKINTVLMRGLNDDEAPDLLAWALEHDYELRFIEQMPLDPQHGWQRADMVTAEEILQQLATRFTLTPEESSVRGSAPAERWRPGQGRRDRLRHPPVLPRLRPHPAHRRRPGPQLPVRPRGVRPAHGAALGGLRRANSRPVANGHVGQEGRLGAGRPLVPPAAAPDVGDRRLTRRVTRRCRNPTPGSSPRP
jgi:GTP 3',8-cyclase